MRSTAIDNLKFNELVTQLSKDYPFLNLIEGDHFRWSPEDTAIVFSSDSPTATWSLLHEVGHMVCGHKDYTSDIGLMVMEVDAWRQARELAKKYNINVDENHIEKCLDSYREWIYRRSSCPVCTQAGLEKQTGLYICINCRKQWKVTSARFCRVYRKTVTD